MDQCRNPDQHKMRYKQYKCACDTRNKCTLAYEVRSCEYTGKCKHFIWVSGEHIDDNVKLPNVVCQYLFKKFLNNILKTIQHFLRKDYYLDYLNRVKSKGGA